jgi:hypothetical protein
MIRRCQTILIGILDRGERGVYAQGAAMRKIISLFQRNYEGNRLVRDEVVPGAEWVIAGEGIPTRKMDGTCCLVRNGELFKRYDAKKGKTPPINFEPAHDYDEITGHMPGWVPVGNGPEDRWHREAFAGPKLADGTYELCGPKIQGNPERFDIHVLLPHGDERLSPDTPRSFDKLRDYFAGCDIEGIVWHHPDGRMVKIKKKDFGFKRL